MEKDTKTKIKEALAQERAALIQIVDIYGCDMITQQFIAYLPEYGEIGLLTSIILELDEQLWIRSLPHAPSSIKSKENRLEYYPNKFTHIIFDRYILGPKGVPVPRGSNQIVPSVEEMIQGYFKDQGSQIKNDNDTQPGIFVRLWRKIWKNQK